ncbi:MAG TPA: NAD(P)/FAD-dependent oxidoreductase [Bacteroidia bacterium]|jgi:dihydrolipoamide dehydrogenase|nr:NAD(P)/FAD-dependent oxidoreductase [Bacteroidia bacterium]
MDTFDLVVIGGGPAGYAGAMRAVDFKKKVLLIERQRIGGAAVYDGVLSSKTMWEHSMKVATIRETIPGYRVQFTDADKVVRDAIFERKTQMTTHLRLLEAALGSKYFHLEKGNGKILSKNRVEITKENGEKKIIQTENILIATGSRPRYLPHISIDEKIILTSDGVKNIPYFPKSMVILGAGVIGCEFATIFSNFGETQVNLIDKADRILPMEDEDISATVTENLEHNGVVVHHNSQLERMEIKNGKVEYELLYKDGKREIITVDKALVAVGRVPNIENIGLENAGVKLSERGFISHSDTQTNIPNIYVAGDVTGGIALVNVGEREARHAAVRMFGPPIKPINYKNISTIMFLNPEVAAVGMSEQEAKEKNLSFKVVKLDYSTNARAIAMRNTNGFFKILVTNDDEMHILGMRVVGVHASSAIQAVAYLVHTNHGIRELADMIHPHPSIIEGVQECLRMLLGKSIYKPAVFRDKLQCYTCADGVCTPISSLITSA